MNEVAEDRISNLPVSLLHHILSFVDTCDAARTGVLSTRWKYIWRSIPVLHFHCRNSSQADKFMEFVDRTLELHDELNIQKFSLHSDVDLDKPRIKKWISTVISRNVERFSLRLGQRDVDPIPSLLYTCESLITLELLSWPNICFPISFPRLKVLMLGGAEFRECRDEQTFSNCPKLEYLVLGFCSWSDMKSFCISNPVLKILSIFNSEEEQDGFRNCSLKIHAPNLEVFTYRGRVAKDYVLLSFPALVQAEVDFFLEKYGAMSEQEIDDYGAAVRKFLLALANVTNLTISNRTLQVLSDADDLLKNLPSFHKLHNLSLTQKLTVDKALVALLEKAPNLVVLEFDKFVPTSPGEEEDDGGENDDYNYAAEIEDNSENEDTLDIVTTRCCILHLKLVIFNEFTGNAREMRWLKMILKNAKALEVMVISWDPNSYMKNENVLADISSFPRASAGCVFKFFSNQD